MGVEGACPARRGGRSTIALVVVRSGVTSGHILNAAPYLDVFVWRGVDVLIEGCGDRDALDVTRIHGQVRI